MEGRVQEGHHLVHVYTFILFIHSTSKCLHVCVCACVMSVPCTVPGLGGWMLMHAASDPVSCHEYVDCAVVMCHVSANRLALGSRFDMHARCSPENMTKGKW